MPEEVLYTAIRVVPPLVGVMLWAWFRDGSLADPANLLLLVSLGAGVLGLASVRRYWVIRNTSRSRRNSSLLG